MKLCGDLVLCVWELLKLGRTLLFFTVLILILAVLVLLLHQSTKKLLVTGNNNNGLYRIEDPGLKVLYSSRQCSATDEVWHMRLGHPQPEVLKLLSENKAISISRSLNKLCESCRLAKSTRLPFYDYVFVASKPLERYTVISGVRLLLYRFKVFNTMWCLLTTIQDSAGFIRLS
ncbi:hypothetical protein Bca4012_042660 [Brassica carinata]|uniref:GAG-pre-integrase domain-containing protein n=2 Tax=Brassica TaxID=3705 RepID=A0A3P6DU54_BRAOL|nr:unnamed protein product [Brassica napus]CDY53795.1 BnaCnng25640D [Brassica napus]VDD29876.1 unnamed protein product [Brassica oleracea]